MAEQTNSLRFKRGGVEFEIVGSAADVGKAWDSLGEIVAEAFKNLAASTPEPEEGSGGDGGQTNKTTSKKTTRKATPRKSTASGGAGATARADVRKKLLGNELENFPDLGDAPTARYMGYALLNWAREQLEIEGLTAQEIRDFYLEKFNMPNTDAAYREGFRGRGREVMKSGNPAVFRLTRDGQRELQKMAAAPEQD